MPRNSPVSIEIYKKHLALFRYLNDTWIFTELIRPDLKTKADIFAENTSSIKKPYPVPKRDKTVKSMRRDSDLAKIFQAQYDRQIFETNIISIISRIEAFIQECLGIAIQHYPHKLSLIAGKTGIPIGLFLEHQNRNELLERFIALRCEAMMFGKPSEYLDKVAEVLSIQIDGNTVADYIELKASRDIIIHNSGKINRLYIEKVDKGKARGTVGAALPIDADYFEHVIITGKALSGAIQRNVESHYK